MRALLVDDDQSIRTVIRRILTRQFPTLEFTECRDGVEALGHLERDQYALLLLDLMMPNMDGFEVLEQVRATTAHRDLPVIMMTGNSDEHSVRRILSVGVTDYILKPIRPAQLCERVARIAGQAPAVRERSAVTAAAASAATMTPMALTAKSQVLLVDGSDEFRNFFRKTIASLCRVEVTSSGLDAFERCLAQSPQAVFIGSDLGKITSSTLARKLRANPQFAAVRLIGIEPKRTIEDARASGAYDAVIERTSAAEALMSSIQAMVAETRASLLTSMADFRDLATGAVQGAIGSALALDMTVRPDPGATRLPTVATTGIRTSGHDSWLEVALSINSADLPRLARRLATARVVTGAEVQERALTALLLRVAESLIADLRTRGVEATASGDARGSMRVASPRDETVAIEFEVPAEKSLVRVHVTAVADAAATALAS